MVFDPTLTHFDTTLFPIEDWRHTLYASAKEELPPNVPAPRGFGFIISTYVDSDHAVDSVTRRSCTGFIVYLKMHRSSGFPRNKVELKQVPSDLNSATD